MKANTDAIIMQTPITISIMRTVCFCSEHSFCRVSLVIFSMSSAVVCGACRTLCAFYPNARWDVPGEEGVNCGSPYHGVSYQKQIRQNSWLYFYQVYYIIICLSHPLAKPMSCDTASTAVPFRVWCRKKARTLSVEPESSAELARPQWLTACWHGSYSYHHTLALAAGYLIYTFII